MALGPGYAVGMSEPETKPGPANPEPEGLDAPTPPGGPQRQDGAEGGLGGGHGDTASEHSDEHGGTIPIEDEQPGEDPGTIEDEDQRENAETSLDQPSEG